VKIVTVNAKNQDDAGVQAIRDHILGLKCSDAMMSQKMASAAAAVARDAAELLQTLQNHKKIMMETHYAKMRRGPTSSEKLAKITSTRSSCGVHRSLQNSQSNKR